MSTSEQVISRDGVQGIILSDQPADADADCVRVRFESGQILLVPRDLLMPGAKDGYSIDADVEDLAAFGNITERIVVPLVAEELEVGKRTLVTGTVRVRTEVQQHEQTVDEPTLREEVDVERVPVGRIVDAAPEARYEGDTLIVPVFEEVLVIEKRLMLTEEVRITRRRTVERTPQQVTLRREHLVVEREPGASAPADGQTDVA